MDHSEWGDWPRLPPGYYGDDRENPLQICPKEGRIFSKSKQSHVLTLKNKNMNTTQ